MENGRVDWEQLFRTELLLISDMSLRAKVLDILNMYVDERHVHEGASSTGKYHPEFSQGEGGLIRHTKAVVFILKELCNTRPDMCTNNLIAAAILHDMKKYVGNDIYTKHEHPALMAAVCMDEGLVTIAHLIESHMGQWTANKRSPIVLPMPITEDAWLLHYADYLASRKWLNLNFMNNELVTV